MDDRNWQVGMKVTLTEYGGVRKITTIEKIYKKYFTVKGGSKFNFMGSSVSRNVWDGSHCRPTKPDDYKPFYERKIRDFDFQKCTLDQLKRIIEIIDETN